MTTGELFLVGLCAFLFIMGIVVISVVVVGGRASQDHTFIEEEFDLEQANKDLLEKRKNSRKIYRFRRHTDE